MKSIYSLWRQTDNIDDIMVNETDPMVGDLVGLYFPQLAMLQNASVEVVPQEFVEGYYISAAAGTTSASDDYMYAITDVSDYDYVLIPGGLTSPGTPLSGICAGPGTQLSPRFAISGNVGNTIPVQGYMCMQVDETNCYAAVSQRANVYMPLIGIKFIPE